MFTPVAQSDATAAQPTELPPNWESHVYQLERSRAAELGFSVGGVKVTANTKLLIMDTMRVRTIRKGRTQKRLGCGYRLVLEISDVSLAARLTLPVIAATVETSDLEASVTLEVKGYKGNEIWTVIPAPEPFGVETYRRYLEAAANIQRHFAAHEDKCLEVILAVDDARSDLLIGGIDDDDVRGAVGVVLASQQLASGRTLGQALEDIDEIYADEVIGLYRFVRGDDFDLAEAPNEAERAKARAGLASLRN